jgi:hypothetical protein
MEYFFQSTTNALILQKMEKQQRMLDDTILKSPAISINKGYLPLNATNL